MLLDLVVCDDVRQEKGDKFTLVGVYTDAIKVATDTWPAVMPKIGFFVRVAPLVAFVPERYSLRILHNTTVLADVGDNINVKDPLKTITLVVLGSPFLLPGPGSLRFELSFLRGDQVHAVPVPRTIDVVNA